MISQNLQLRLLTGILLFFLVSLIFISDFVLVYSLIVLGILSVLEFFNLMSKISIKKNYKFIFNILFTLYIFIFCFLFLFFSFSFQLKVITFIILIGCISSDIGGYIFGKTFKGPKLTKISPNKTISGAVGSIFLTCFSISLITYLLVQKINIEIVLIAFFISVSSQLGDLFFSFLKRKAKIKNTGNILPGHGGILDRLDGIYLGLPIGYLILILLT